ncbi:hypothetical protein [Spiroplasma endosymbiont of Lasioglossum malachurum]|uniref:hypothetical protein n=1 Tax=Spiroplasma endosymbiont of Lasioglossum malachurum TaxID=3066319 RepID=UPI0030D61D12
MIFFRKSTYLLESSSIFLFLRLLLGLKIINIPHVYAVNGQTIFISETRYENKGHFAYLLDFKREEYLKFNSFNQITIFFSINKCYLTIFFPKWNDNNQLLIEENINSNTYLNQMVLIIIGKESLLTFIWNNITT